MGNNNGKKRNKRIIIIIFFDKYIKKYIVFGSYWMIDLFRSEDWKIYI